MIIHRYKPVTKSTAYYDICTVEHHWDDCGNHRLEIEGCVSDWASYTGIAKLKWKDRIFCGSTEYWFGDLPEIFEIHSIREHDAGTEEEAKQLLPPEPLTLAQKLAAKRAASGGSAV
jgi:hypothetical protein